MAENKIPVTFLQCVEDSLPEEKIPGRWIIVTDKPRVYLDIDDATRLTFDNGLENKTATDTVPVHIDEEGQLWVSPYVLNSFTEDKLGGLMGVHSAEQVLSSPQELGNWDYRQFKVGQAYTNYPEIDKSGKASVLIPIASAELAGLVSGPKKTENETQEVHISESGAMFVPKIPDYFNNFAKALDGGTISLTLNKENGIINIEYKDGASLINTLNSLELGALIKFTFQGTNTSDIEYYNCIKADNDSWTLFHIGDGENFVPTTLILTKTEDNVTIKGSSKPLLIALSNSLLTPPFNGAKGIVYNPSANWAYDIESGKVLYKDGVFNTDDTKKVTFSEAETNNQLMVILPEA